MVTIQTWLFPMHSNLKFTRVCDSRRWAEDNAGKRKINIYNFVFWTLFDN